MVTNFIGGFKKETSLSNDINIKIIELGVVCIFISTASAFSCRNKQFSFKEETASSFEVCYILREHKKDSVPTPIV